MNIGRLKWLVFVLIFRGIEPYDPYRNQPKLMSQNGHLIIQGAEHSNITLRTTGSGRININNEDLMHIAEMAVSAAATVNKFKADYASGGSDLPFNTDVNVKLKNYNRRLAELETLMANVTSSQTPFDLGSTKIMMRKMRFITTKVLTMARDIRLFRKLLMSDECESNPCQHGGTCYDMFNGYRCLCTDKWEGRNCEVDVNECSRFDGTDLGCQNGATCKNLPGSYSCLCPDGWFGLHCTRRTYDCTSQNSAELCGHGICVNQGETGRGFVCICDQGWKAPPGQGACTMDVDECAAKISPCSHDPPVPCINTPGSFYCGGCPKGYSGDGYQCRDVDECLVSNGGCSENPLVQCINTRGSRVCGPCPPGYSGNGETCDQMTNFCQVKNGGCHRTATCVHNPGLHYVICQCPPGWTGSGVGDVGCTRMNSTRVTCIFAPCKNGGTCFDTVSGYICRCPQPYTGDNCAGIGDSCDSQPCQNGGHCTSLTMLEGGYYCECNPGYSGIHCQNKELGCVAKFNSEKGNYTFPLVANSQLYNSKDCFWRLINNKNKAYNITIQVTAKCYSAYAGIHDGSRYAPSARKYCGQDEPFNIITAHPLVFISYYSSSDKNKIYFEWKTVNLVCGGTINATNPGSIGSPGAPFDYPNNANCYWYLNALPGKRIQFSFFSMGIATPGNKPGECGNDFLEIRDGPSDNSPVMKMYCQQTLPPPIITSSNEAVLHFKSGNHRPAKGFQLTYSTVEGMPGCGGYLTSPFGRITPPSSLTEDGSYGENLRCEWKIQLPHKERIKLEFTKFNIEHSIACKYDFIEVYDGPTTSSGLVGRYCGPNIPKSFTSTGSSVLIVFRSDFTYNAGSFQIDYIGLCGGVFMEKTGILTSPYYPDHYPSDRQCEYLIQVSPGSAVSLTILDLDVEDSVDDDCYYDQLQIYDGDSNESPLRETLCGNDTSDRNILSTHNFMYLVFITDASRHGRGFYANYTTVVTNCGGIYVDISGTITTSNDIVPGSECRYIIKAPLNHLIQLTWQTFILEKSMLCLKNYVKIYENGTDPASAHQLGESYCGNGLPPTMTSSSNIMMIVLQTTQFSVKPNFRAFFSAVEMKSSCGGNFYSTSGRIQSPNYPENYPNGVTCLWTITVANGRQISLNFENFTVEGNSRCGSDYLEIRNGGYESSPLIKRLCGKIDVQEIRSQSNQLFMKFISDPAVSRKGFSLTWDGTLSGCGGTLQGSSGSITSPGYPQAYGRNAECYWRIAVPQGSVIMVMLVDVELEPHRSCHLDYLEIYDGTNSKSKSLGRFCSSNHPPSVTSTQNSVFIKFKSDISRQGRGFHLKYTTVCNRTIHGFRGVIESPNYPEFDPNPKECFWTIAAPIGNKVHIMFSNFVFTISEFSRYVRKVVKVDNCTEGFVELTETIPEDGNHHRVAANSLGKFCATTMLPHALNSTLTDVLVHYKSTPLLIQNTFRLEWMIIGCGGKLTGKLAGTFTSPNYPKPYQNSVICEWYISVPLGKSIEITIEDLELESPDGCVYDHVMIYGGPDDTSPLLIKACHSQTGQTKLRTSGNHAFVRFTADDNNNGRGFSASYEAKESQCGGEFEAYSGYIYSRNYPQNYNNHDDCSYRIEVSSTMRINLTFVDFDVYSSDTRNCSSSYVKVYDGEENNSTLLATLCGNVIPGQILSTGNVMTIRHNSGGLVSKGFKGFYQTQCGATITTSERGSIDFDKAPLNNPNCSWTIKSTQLDSKVTIQFPYMSLARGPKETNGSYITVYAGENTESPLVGRYFGTMSPPGFVVPSSVVTVTYTETIRNYWTRDKFIMEYSVLNTDCGGYYVSERGTITSPDFPSNYPTNAECEWIIYTSPGNKITLQFDSFNVESEAPCNEDYVEIRSKTDGGTLLGAYCGQTVPEKITYNTSLWIKFKSSEEGSDKGFQASYSLVHGGELSGPVGEVSSPLYPDKYSGNGKFNWRIVVKTGFVIRVAITDLYFDLNFNGICREGLKFYDGYDRTAPLLKAFCSIDTPEPFTSGSNVLYVAYDSLRALGSKFHFDWIQMERTLLKGNDSSSKNNCSTTVQFGANSTTHTFSSPGFPNGYSSKLKCEWIFETGQQNHIAIMFDTIDLENSQNCYFDYAEVFTIAKDSVGEWKSLKKLCRHNETNEEIIGSNLMKVVFTTDRFENKTGFQAQAYQVCGGDLDGPSGVITIGADDQIQHVPTCEWKITVKPGKQIQLIYNKFKFPDEPGNACKSNYIIVRDGGFKESPFLGNGKYCGNTAPNVTKSNSNRLFIQAVVFTGVELELAYETVSLGCSQEIVLNKNGLSHVNISSPNYPNIPPAHVECVWKITSSLGESLHFEFLERFDLAVTTECSEEFVELRDGTTEISPVIGRYCTVTPSSIFTEGNGLYVKYFTDVDEPNNGFKARISLASCGGTLYDYHGTINSPGYPNAYDAFMNCTWRLIGYENSRFLLTFTQMELGRSALNNSCKGVDSIQIKETGKWSAISSGVETFCGSKTGETFETGSNDVLLTFTSFKQPTFASSRKFSIDYASRSWTCGGRLSMPRGILKSPGYPYTKGLSYCLWRITAPQRKRITLTIEDFNLGTPTQINNRSEDDIAATLMIFNDFQMASEITTLTGTVTNGTVVESTGNKMLVYMTSAIRNEFRGFKARYDTLMVAKCGGELLGENGTIQISSLDLGDSFACTWTSNKNATISFKMIGSASPGPARLGTSCVSSSFTPSPVPIRITNYASHIVNKFCGTTEPNRPVILSNFGITNISFMKQKTPKNEKKYNVSLTIEWNTHECGGTLQEDKSLNLLSPRFPLDYPPNTHCTWVLSFLDATVKVRFNSFALNMTNSKEGCPDYLVIHNKNNPMSPKLGTYCGTVVPADLISENDDLWIEFHSDVRFEAQGFNLTLSKEEQACGGLKSSDEGEISSPDYPTPYKNNVECVWEINVGQGYHIGLVFNDRFFIEEEQNCSKDYVEISDHLNGTWVPLGRVCGRILPRTFNTTSNKMRIIFRSNDRITADGFIATWNTNCGGVIYADKPGYINSPGYPNSYEGPLFCNYTIVAPGKTLFVFFNDFDLEDGQSGQCIFDKLDIKLKRRNGIIHLGTYCGSNKPPPFPAVDMVSFEFTADLWSSLKGFSLEYKFDPCNNFITVEGPISAPIYQRRAVPYGQYVCTWNITAPENRHIVIRDIELQIRSSSNCYFSYLKLYEGFLANNSALIATLCGDLTNKEYRLRTEGRYGLLQLKLFNMFNSKMFSGVVTFPFSEKAGCGGVKIITGATTLNSPDMDKDGAYEPLLDCVWTLKAPQDQALRLSFSNFNVSDECFLNTTCSCDFLEIYDGDDENKPPLVKLCGSKIPGDVISSKDIVLVRFVTDDIHQRSGFKINITPYLSACGNTTLIATKTAKTLTSPNFPNNYPSSIHCVWNIVSSAPATYPTIDIRIEEINIEEADECQGDRLEISDLTDNTLFNMMLPTWRSGIVSAFSAGKGKKIYEGRKSIGGAPSLYMGARYPYTTSIFCGKVIPFDYYSGTNRVQLRFLSGDTGTMKGFKLSYAIASCSRNFTDEQGRIVVPRREESCTILVKAPNPNATIALYFVDLAIPCSSSLKVYDGSDDNNLKLDKCGYRVPNPVFSTQSTVLIKYKGTKSRYGSFEIMYTTTDQGPGCGGNIFSYGGLLSSPMYPGNYRNSSVCKWYVSVPEGNDIILKFTDFDLGSSLTCETDNVKLYDLVDGQDPILRSTYCGQDKPAQYTGLTGSILVEYKTSLHNGGMGWLARFMSQKSLPSRA